MGMKNLLDSLRDFSRRVEDLQMEADNLAADLAFLLTEIDFAIIIAEQEQKEQEVLPY